MQDFPIEFLKDILTSESNGIKLSFLFKNTPNSSGRKKNAVNLIK